MIAYQTDENGRYVGTITCDESPLEPGVFLVPRGAVEIEPPAVGENEYAVWNKTEWAVEPSIVEPEPAPEPTREDVEELRLYAYQRESDPVFFDWQRGVATEADWHAASQAVRDAYPYP